MVHSDFTVSASRPPQAPADQNHPHTRDSLAKDMRTLGLRSGDLVLVHASLKSLGWTSGGAVAVIQALQDVLTPWGTLVVPTHTSGLTDPTRWQNPPVPPEWVPQVQASLPAFDPERTPSEWMGAVAETLRTWPDVQRSHHPHVSFAAWGADAAAIVDDHELSMSLGEGSPLARLYDHHARVLLIGTNNCTSLHLAEVRAGTATAITQGAPVLRDGQRQWVQFSDLDYDDTHFADILDEFAAAQPAHTSTGRLGSAVARLLEQRPLVDFATGALGRKVE
ncbi:AAC(3) family N-acetyltransferase [Nocardia speluncae]|uniref:Aminoglycoside N(3)-acetyltransferase n=2 Tax=Nocardia speluncae TaxID=419477 RepID=A0A846XPR1_9NOCA|nr:AAC(3) family N-acetyltransferase [Nocardia speluncae]